MNIIKVSNVIKTYPNFTLGQIDLSIPSGMIVGLIGENGAGKTTLLKLILDISEPDEGQITVFGKSNQDITIKDDIGVVMDNMFFPEILTVQNIDSINKSSYQNYDSALFYRYLSQFNIDPKQKLKTLSKGNRKKVEIASALAHHPKLLILDEPTGGLDPVVRNEVLTIFQHFVEDENHTIVFSTHITSDLEHIADKIIFLDNGKVYLDEYRDNIFDNYGILKCDSEQFAQIDKEDMVSYLKNLYYYQVLVKDKEKCQKKYQTMIMDQITLEDLMLLIIKGEK
ncbi:MAG: ABC transporter ATP-binding protein [Erysipelotrichaceae bacterium]